ncbi:molybdenum transport system permease protein ModB [Halalkalibacter hemicellulosilyticusJCM 9152]|uniref:Molybdenum transport system permease n=2 Tax=Halalkalibacter TaxID=2893056 RepID=W4QCS5_9BACI|nr:molybdenum transport system permease protein ModB [Halalkalibacter hemicellulosilyticusJCM 9152]
MIASIVSFITALFVAWWMKDRKFKGKSALDTLLMLPLVLPPTVVGFGLLTLLGRQSFIGRSFEWLFSQPLVFSFWAAVVAAAVVAFPLIYQTLRTGFESVDSELIEAARQLGGNEKQIFRFVILPLSWRYILTGYMLGFARGLGEFGATIMFAGNIPGRTQTMPSAIYSAVQSGRTEMAYFWVITLVLFSFVLLSVVQRLKP